MQLFNFVKLCCDVKNLTGNKVLTNQNKKRQLFCFPKKNLTNKNLISLAINHDIQFYSNIIKLINMNVPQGHFRGEYPCLKSLRCENIYFLLIFLSFRHWVSARIHTTENSSCLEDFTALGTARPCTSDMKNLFQNIMKLRVYSNHDDLIINQITSQNLIMPNEFYV